ncbi:MAG: lysozyme inhibitor LprI family protein [Anaerolineae bacterium]|nr:lysozyme inhibitor LprI family protein [Anaerolineae bacterium]
MKRPFLILLGWLMLSFAVHAASFDCGKTTTKVERLICANTTLSKLDEELAAAYNTALQNEKQTVSIQQAQKQWRKVRNGCSDAVCVKRAYEDRLKALTISDRSAGLGKAGMIATPAQADKAKSVEQAFPQMPPKLRYTFCDRNKPELYCEGQTGKGYSVCEAYLKHLQTLTNPPTCEAPTPPGFKQPDWEEMDVTQHLDLAYQAEEFFLKKFGGYKHPDFDTWRQTFLQEIHDGKINPRMRNAKVRPNDKGDATILAYTRDRDACHKGYGSEDRQDAKANRRLGLPPNPYWSSQGNAGQLWTRQGNVHFVLPDDTPHTLQVIVGDASRTTTDLLLYSGKPYLVEILREYEALYKNREEQARMSAGLADGKSITWMDNSGVIVFAFDPRFPDRIRLQLDLNHYLVDTRCQFIPY